MSEEIKKDWKKIKDEFAKQDEEAVSLEEETLDASTDGALEHPSYRKLEEQLTLAEQQAHENWEKAVRAMAELDNVRRRAERDVASAHKFALEKFASGLLEVIDSLEQAMEHLDDKAQEGLVLTMKLFLDVLAKHGIEQLDPQGENFDPQEQEAMSIQSVDGVPHNTVLTVLQKGYRLNERVIRPARVIVAK